MSLLVRRWARAYERSNPKVRVQVKRVGADISTILSGSADLVYADRPLKVEEFNDAQPYGIVPEQERVAIDALGIVINASNPAPAQTLRVIAAIFAGDLNGWKDLGGPDHAISRYCMSAKSRAHKLLEKTVLHGREVAEDCTLVDSVDALKRALAKDPYGIGYARLPFLVNDESLKVVAIRQGKDKPNANPTRADGKWVNAYVVTGDDYPLKQTLYFHSTHTKAKRAKAFLAWVLSPEGQKIAEKEGYIALPGRLPEPPKGVFD